jgi:hypothetical protein
MGNLAIDSVYMSKQIRFISCFDVLTARVALSELSKDLLNSIVLQC